MFVFVDEAIAAGRSDESQGRRVVSRVVVGGVGARNRVVAGQAAYSLTVPRVQEHYAWSARTTIFWAPIRSRNDIKSGNRICITEHVTRSEAISWCQMVPGVGLEPTCPLGQPVLSGPRLPVAPPGHARHGSRLCPVRPLAPNPLLPLHSRSSPVADRPPARPEQHRGRGRRLWTQENRPQRGLNQCWPGQTYAATALACPGSAASGPAGSVAGAAVGLASPSTASHRAERARSARAPVR